MDDSFYEADLSVTSFGIEDINFLAGISKNCPSYDLSDEITFYETRPSGYKLSESSTKGEYQGNYSDPDEERSTYFHCSLIVDKSEPVEEEEEDEDEDEDKEEEGEVDIE